MLRRCSVLLNDPPLVSGGPVLGLMHETWKRTAIRPSIMDAQITQSALEVKMSSLLAREMQTEKLEAAREPPLKRRWVQAPVSQLSTSLSRRDWFRLMSFNMMTDAWGPCRTTPVEAVQVRVPEFTRNPECDDPDAFCDYDPSVDKEVPPFLAPEYRRKHLVELLRCYDPDIICLNEVNRTFFNTEMWRYVRFLGYGTLYQSSRGARVQALRKGDNAAAPSNRDKIAEEEDIGNVLLFHKGRFFPLMMPGRDVGQRFHFAHFVGMRDKVTNMTLYVACVQLTAGATAEAANVRLHEARQVLTILDALGRHDADRSHQSHIVCGDLNNQTDDEACVELLRSTFFSTHDLVGGPRWTAWHYRDEARAAAYEAYYVKNVKEAHRSDKTYQAEEEIERFQRKDAGAYHGVFSKVQLVRDEIAARAHKKQQRLLATPNTATSDVAVSPLAGSVGVTAAAPGSSPVSAPALSDAALQVDQLALLKRNRKENGITYNTQDFIFYDPSTLALHQVLDVPEDEEVNEAQLFPNSKLPSHHLPLFIDISWIDTFPDVAARTLKE
ncbi:putative Endonuclease/Exonuclease/phosphatase family [Leishmania utingensis]|uniref:Endonuclease/Exonuclease/phosphatase family n=1 Tax=Leishmania utingensis TaxID=653362 RepID=A0AAW3AZI8_9TRYP